MTDERLGDLAAEAMTPEQRAVVQRLIDSPRGGVRGPFNALLRSPELADRVRRLGDYVRFESALPDVLREFAIMLVARFWSADYEWNVHRQLALDAGLDPAVADAIATGRRPSAMTGDQTLVYDFVTELLYAKDVGDAPYSAALERFGERALVDILATAGYFSFVSLILNAKRHPVPPGGTRLAASASPL